MKKEIQQGDHRPRWSISDAEKQAWISTMTELLERGEHTYGLETSNNSRAPFIPRFSELGIKLHNMMAELKGGS